MALLFVIPALGVALISALFTSQATLGVAGLTFACLLGILGRLAQAWYQHWELKSRMDDRLMPLLLALQARLDREAQS